MTVVKLEKRELTLLVVNVGKVKTLWLHKGVWSLKIINCLFGHNCSILLPSDVVCGIDSSFARGPNNIFQFSLKD